MRAPEFRSDPLTEREPRRSRAVLDVAGDHAVEGQHVVVVVRVERPAERLEPWLGSELTVVLNGRNLAGTLDDRSIVLTEVRRRSGLLLRFDSEGLVEVLA